MTAAQHQPSIVAISRERHAGKGWQAPASYEFAKTNHLVPISAAEIAHAARSMPLAFVQSGDRLVLVAMLSLLPGNNLFVGPDGKWLGPYIPAALRAFPFILANSGAGAAEQFTLAFDEASGLLSHEGTPFFAEDGVTPHARTSEMLQFLVQVRRGNDAVSTAVAALQAAEVLEPWPINLKDGETTRAVQGISRINEAALNKLSDDAFLALRRAGALPVAYAQLMAVQNLSVLQRLAQAQGAARQAPRVDASKLFSPAMEDEKFDWESLLKD
ncbi:SapC family protein [Devosia sp. 919]|uniref:SapC family protein n=1 Tax=Devosia sp. 919 TaxID=2726065 RepID=UPI0015547FE7|nr:SapC family protein [Devosia sp. 919]